MAKGDKSRQARAISVGESRGGEREGTLGARTEGMRGQFWDDYLNSQMRGQQERGDIMNLYRGQIGGGYSPVSYSRTPEFGEALAGFSEFGKTGGYSDADVANMRARGVSPIRATYARAMENLNRQKALQGGYSPNAAAAGAKMARELSMNLGDASTNLEAQLAEMKQRGRLAGYEGLGRLSTADLQMMMDAARANQMAGLQARGLDLDALRGMSSLYSTGPGEAEAFGRMALSSMGQGIDVGQMGNQFDLGMLGARQNQSQMPGNWQSFWGNVQAPFEAVGSMRNAFRPF